MKNIRFCNSILYDTIQLQKFQEQKEGKQWFTLTMLKVFIKTE